MQLTVRYALELSETSGVRQESLDLGEGASAADVVDLVFRRHGAVRAALTDRRSGALLPKVKLLINGRDIRFMDGLKTRVSEGDRVSLLPGTGACCG